MATNELLPFANGGGANVIDFSSWNALSQRQSGFVSGVASSQQFNRILAQGGAAGYVVGQMVADLANQNATIDATALYTNFKLALQTFIKKEVGESLLPTGSVIFVHATDVPQGLLLCNGAAVSRTKYAKLFSVIGTKYGSGDGSSTFNLPNLNGRVLQATSNIGDVGKFLEAQLPNIRGLSMNFCLTSPNYGISSQGAFYNDGTVGGKSIYATSTADSGHQHIDSFQFEASKSSATYLGTKLQPSALQLLACIRC